MPVLTPAMPVEGLQSCSKPDLTTAQHVECLWRIAIHVWTELVVGLQMFTKQILTTANPVKGLQRFNKIALITAKLSEGLQSFPKPFFPTAKLVESLQMIVMAVLTTAMPVESL